MASSTQDSTAATEDDHQATLGELIRRKRRSMRLSQAQVGEIFGVDQSSVAKWEKGVPAKAERLEDLGMWLGIGLEEAFRRNHPQPAPMPVGGDIWEAVNAIAARQDQIEKFITEIRDHLLGVPPAVPARKAAAAKKAVPVKKAAVAIKKAAAAKATPARRGRA